MLWKALALMALTSGTLAFASDALATFGDDERSIRGTWILSVRGHVAVGAINDEAPPGTPIVAIGRVIFDGNGSCRSDDQIVVGNVPIPPVDPYSGSAPRRIASECHYTVQPDGYGVFFVTFDEPVRTTTTARFIIESFDRISFIADNEVLGIYGAGTLTRRTPRGR